MQGRRGQYRNYGSSPLQQHSILRLQSMDKVAGRTFASQFQPLGSGVLPFQTMILAIKNKRADMLAMFTGKQLQQVDEGGKNLLFYAVYEKSDECLLRLLLSGLPYADLDKQNKNIYHFITYSGSLQCLQVLGLYAKLSKLMMLNKSLLDKLAKYGYKRTDVKAGKLKYTVSPKKLQMFRQLQKQAQNMYAKYHEDYLKQMGQFLKQPDNENQRNPVHLGCLNKYQKCLATLEQLIKQVLTPDITIEYKIMQYFDQINQGLEQKIDPRNYQSTLQCLGEILVPEQKQKIFRKYQKQARKLIREVLQAQDKDKQSALFIASKNGSTGMINFLQKYTPEPKAEQKEEIMKVALNNIARSCIIDLCEASKLPGTTPMNFLISCGEEVNEKRTIFGTFPLLQAIKSFTQDKSLEPFKTLIKSGADVNTQDTNGWTVMHHAASLGLIEVIGYLLSIEKQTRLDINKLTNKRYHALHLASMNEHPEIIKLLLDHHGGKVNVDVADWDGCTALIHAAKKGSIQCLEVLLALEANLYARDARDMTALHHAAFTFHPQCIRQLLYYDSDFDKLRQMRNTKGKLAKDLCTDSRPFESIFTAARTGNVNLIRKLIAENSSLIDKGTPQKDRTPLILAVLAKSLVSVKFLVDMGADTYHEDKEGKSAGAYCEELLLAAKKSKNDAEIKQLEQIKKCLE